MRLFSGRLAFVVCIFWLLEPGCAEQAEVLPLDLGPSLEASFQDPLYLTLAAARSRTSYLPDEGYSLTYDPVAGPTWVSDQGGTLGIALKMGGEIIALGSESRWVIQHSASDSVILAGELQDRLGIELRFLVVSSRVASLELNLLNEGSSTQDLQVMGWLRRCDLPYDRPRVSDQALEFRHVHPADALTQVTGAGTFVENFTDEMRIGDENLESEVNYMGTQTCGESLIEDLGQALAGGSVPEVSAAVLIGTTPVSIAAHGETTMVLFRGVQELDRAAELQQEMDDVLSQDRRSLFEEGQKRLNSMPMIPGLSRQEELIYRSGYVLLDQLMMPAEGNLQHDYFLFSREPTFYFSRIGQHLQEGMSLILLAHFMPDLAREALRVFIDRMEVDGYLPYNIGPTSEVIISRTASAPLFCYVAWEVLRVSPDTVFLQDAYKTGAALQEFWNRDRDVDQDGLAEWGGWVQIEPIPDSSDVVWKEVAKPDEVESVALNSMLVMEEKSLAEMAAALGRSGEAKHWEDMAKARAQRVNQVMWDEESGFYYHVERQTETFSYKNPNDLKRQEMWGFFPLWAGIVPPERLPRILAKLTDPGSFWRAYGIPSLSAADPSYSPEALPSRWNGPVWVQWQYAFVKTLINLGQKELAQELVARNLASVGAQLSQVHQFRELYHPDDASLANRSHPNYIWTSLISLMMLELNGEAP